ncbi:hypothetical protein DSOL_3813 [Desulfosporosinus metallidurans]|uniref:Uncharacterized protein n=1 Tax=Desulfosporosinus metallidurans TaxID=1888891 RepID=A0A1Q8QNI2_9FIRM|nr:hypothetical protein DSOL_3813 [Desulfosporosinus metallidurans]
MGRGSWKGQNTVDDLHDIRRIKKAALKGAKKFDPWQQ